jgi:two-component system cell cycle sensor histidine kinase/response regulator CckA
MGGRIRSIIIEKDQNLAKWIAGELEFAGLTISWDYVQDEASFHTALNNKPDIILSEYYLSSFNAMKALKILETKRLDIPLIVITGHGNEEVAVKCIKQGAVDFIAKKNIGRLPASVRSALQRSKRKKIQASEQVAVQLSQFIINHSSIAIFGLNREGDLLWANSRALKSLGYTSAALKKMHISQLDAHLDGSRWRDVVQKLHNKRTIFIEASLHSAFGEILPVELTVTSIQQNGNNYIFIISRDIREKRDAQVELHRLYTAIEQATDSIIITNNLAEILYVNPAFEKVTGFLEEEVLGKNPRIIKSGKHDKTFYKALWNELLRGKSWHGHFINRHKDGSLFEQESTISPIKDKAGRIINYVAVNRDVTNEMIMQKQQHLTNKLEALGRLAGGVAHDFNNILTIINGYSELLLNLMKDDSPHRRHVEQIMNASQKASYLTKQLLTFSKRQNIEPQVIDLNEVINDMANMLRRLLGEDIQLVADLESSVENIKADRGQIEQIIINLVVNSREAMPTGGHLYIRTRSSILDNEFCKSRYGLFPGEYVMLSIEDTGKGMTDEEKSKIFEPFYTTKASGYGMGLANVFGIVKQHNGFIECTSELDAGSTFYIYFPAFAESAKGSGQIAELKDFPRGSETILIVEDEDEVRDLAAKMLMNQGYEILEAKHGVDALTICKEREGPLHLLLTDIVMPHIHGPELAERAKKIQPEMKILFMSGYTDDLITPSQRKDNLFFLRKPFTLEQIAVKVRNVLDSKG